MHGLIEPFYVPTDARGVEPIRPGDIFEDQPIYLPAKWGLLLSNFDPTEARDPEFLITGRNENIFQHPPLKRYKLENGEAFILGKAKWGRPVVVLAARGSDVFAGPGTADPLDTVLCAPVYGADQFPEPIRARIRAYEFPNLFYLPANPSPSFGEGFVRFDHVQAIKRDRLRSRRPVMLSEDSRRALEEWLIYYMTGRMAADSLILLYREEQLAKLAEAN